MFSEFLRIKPVLDAASAKSMETSLTGRFARVARSFGTGLKFAVKGSLLGISLGLLAKLLSPLTEIEDKIKALLSRGKELKELADEFGTTPGKLEILQSVAGSFGVTAADFKEKFAKFGQAVDKAREETLNKTADISPSTPAVAAFIQKDVAEGFFAFLQGLKLQETKPGFRFFGPAEAANLHAGQQGKKLSEDEIAKFQKLGLAVPVTGKELTNEAAKTVFGEKLFGSFRQFVEADFAKQLKALNIPGQAQINDTTNKVAKLSDEDSLIKTRNEVNDFIAGGIKLNSGIVQSLEEGAKREQDLLTNKLDSYELMKRGALAVDKIVTLLEDMKDQILKLSGVISQAFTWVQQKTPAFRFFKFSPKEGKAGRD